MGFVRQKVFTVGSVAALSQPLHHHVDSVSVLRLFPGPLSPHVILYTSREEYYQLTVSLG